jgi:ABC-type transport system involved in cytochrome c biogenesis permease component
MALCLWYPTSGLKILTGNPTIWVLAAVAVGMLYAWPLVGVLVKPSIFPLALLGVRHRSWWVALLVLGLAGLPFASLWRDWAVAVLNAQGGGLLYSVQEFPLLCLPLAASIGRAKATRVGTDPVSAGTA